MSTMYQKPGPVTLRERLSMAGDAGVVVTGQFVSGAVVSVLGGLYASVKVVALPIAVVEAFVAPRRWQPPW